MISVRNNAKSGSKRSIQNNSSDNLGAYLAAPFGAEKPHTATFHSIVNNALQTRNRSSHIVIGYNAGNSTKSFIDETGAQISFGKESVPMAMIAEEFLQKLKAAPFPDYWVKDGIARPNEASINNAIEVGVYIFSKYQQTPYAVVPSIEKGVMLKYSTPNIDKNLEIEAYNSGEKAGIFYKGKDIQDFCDVESNSDIDRLIKEYI